MFEFNSELKKEKKELSNNPWSGSEFLSANALPFDTSDTIAYTEKMIYLI